MKKFGWTVWGILGLVFAPIGFIFLPIGLMAGSFHSLRASDDLAMFKYVFIGMGTLFLLLGLGFLFGDLLRRHRLRQAYYGGNYVESQDELLRRIFLPDELLQRLIDYHQRELSRLSYRGPVGIDMMRLSDGRVHPCVEINFRRTMGLLALALYNKGIIGNQLLAGNPRQGFSAQIVDGKLTIVCRSCE